MERRILAQLLLVVLASGLAGGETSEPAEWCKLIKQHEKEKFDLAPLFKHEGNWEAYDYREDGKYIYYMNVCGNLNPISGVDFDSQGVQARSDGSTSGGFPFDLGSYVKYDVKRDVGNIVESLVINYENGADCGSSGVKRSMEINFRCGPKAGLGVPVFVSESDSDCHYTFDWETELMCAEEEPPMFTPCVVNSEEGDEFNINSLGGRIWEATDIAEDGNYTYLISVCQPLDHNDPRVTDHCHDDATSSACQTKKTADGTVFHSKNLGSSGALTLDENGIPTLDFTDGTACGDNPRSAVIKFLCNEGGGLGRPSFVGEERGSCHYEFEWETSAACKSSVTPSVDCVVEDPETGRKIDLKKLSNQEGYTIASRNAINFNICGSIDCGELSNVGACETIIDESGDETKVSLGSVTTTAVEFGSLISLTYEGGSTCAADSTKKNSFELQFQCDPLNEIPYVSETDTDSECLTKLTVNTNLVCDGTTVDCFTTDSEGNEYDLSSLAKQNDNWVVNGNSKDGKSSYKYLLNVCRSVNPSPDPDIQCPIYGAGCQVAVNQTTLKPLSDGVNIGQPASPVKLENGGLELQYTDGKLCSSNGHKRTTKIQFICDKNAGINEPQFLFEDECTYAFSWTTAAACPIETITGQGCKVTDPVTGNSFEFTELSRSPYEIETDSGTFQLGLCSSLPEEKQCGEGQNARHSSLCRESEIIGTTQDQLTYVDGEIVLHMRAPDNGAQHAKILFVCNHEKSGNDGPKLVIANSIDCPDDTECYYEFEWETIHACAPSTEPIQCTTTDWIGRHYDLTSLIKPRGNYHAADEDHEYVVNVCRSIEPVKGCPNNAAACQIPKDETSTRTAKSLGIPTGPSWDEENHRVVIRYTGGRAGCHGTTERTTEIYFECPSDPADSETEPIFLGEDVENCIYMFRFTTTAACPVRIVTGGSDCTFVQQGDETHTYDIGELVKDWDGSMEITGEKQETYNLGFCGATVTCGSDDAAGGCQTTSDGATFSLGKASSTLTFENHELKLRYTGGATCHDIFKRETVITFTCDESKDIGSPVYLGESDDCVYSFEWATSRVCYKSIDCTAFDDASGKLYDLSSLSNTEQNWVATDARDDGKYNYEINICRPLVKSTDLKNIDCSPFASVCQVTRKTHQEDFNLGFPAFPEVENGKVSMTFKNGDYCADIVGPRTSVIHFACPRTDAAEGSLGTPIPGIVGAPKFMKEDKCTYTFEWETSAACPTDAFDLEKTTDCSFISEKDGALFDFSTLHSKKVGLYNIGVCRSVTCSQGDSASCLNGKTSLGSLDSAVFTEMDDGIRLSYKNGAPCGTKTSDGETPTMSTSIFLKCSKDASNTAPTHVVGDDECVHSFVWETEHACRHVHTAECTVFDPKAGKTYDLSLLSQSSQNWQAKGFLFPEEDTYEINVCRTLAATPTFRGCGSEESDAAICLVTTDDKINLGEYTGPSINDEGNVQLHYENGDKCSGDIKYSSTIIFECGKEDTGPFALLYPGGCNYQFQWTTPAACSLEPDSLSSSSTEAPFFSECQVWGDGDKYDLSPLSNVESNWFADYTGTADLEFFLSVCTTLKLDSHVTSACKGAAVCKVPVQDKSAAEAIGYLSQGPTFIEQGVIELKYGTGEQIIGDTSCSPETTITLYCRKGDLGVPVVTSQNKCEISIDWFTSAACPEAEIVEGDDCSVEDPVTGARYDLSGLIDTQLKDSDEETNVLTVGICSAPVDDNGEEICDGGSCTENKKSGDIQSNGKVSKTLELREGNLFLHYKDGSPCQENSNIDSHSTVIEFQCDEKADTPFPTYEIAKSHFCLDYFTISTSSACPPREVECEVIGPDDKLYDLHVLEMVGTDPNWEVFPESTSDYSFYINVCRGLTNTGQVKEAKCSPRSAVCQIKDNKHTWSLGTVSAPYFDGNDLKIKFTGGSNSLCPGSRETTVTFECDPNPDPSLPLGQPKILDESVNCKYDIVWKTSAACAVKSQPATSDCKITDDVTGVEYDFTELSNTNPEITGKDGHTYKFQICGDPSLKCGDDRNVAACQDDAYLVGTKSALNIRGGDVFATFQGGSTCHQKYERDAIVTFVCDEDAGVGSPEFLHEYGDCTYEFEWRTKYKCPVEKQSLQCLVDDKDLTPLADDESIEVDTSAVANFDGSLYINVCHEVQHGRCTSETNAGALLVKGSSCKSLGSFNNIGPSHSADGKVVTLTYPNGAKVDDTCRGNAETQITFECNQNGGKPRLTDIIQKGNACTYAIKWGTPTVCGIVPPASPPTSTPTTGKGGSNDGDKSTGTTEKPKSSEGGGGGGNTGIVIGVVLISLIAIIIVAYVLVSPSRRYKIMSYFGKASKPTYMYTNLPTDSEENGGDSLPFLLTNGSSDEDDSDDELDNDDQLLPI